MTHLSKKCFELFDAVFQTYDIPIRSFSAYMLIVVKIGHVLTPLEDRVAY
jgi:hypothetical protein